LRNFYNEQLSGAKKVVFHGDHLTLTIGDGSTYQR